VIGAIAGDVIGSIYEGTSLRTKNFNLFSPKSCFTDDSVLSVAVADALLTNSDYASQYKVYCRRYPGAGYGSNFFQWAFSESTQPYNSYGNGASMRVSPVSYAFENIEAVLKEARETAIPTHNHPEAVRGASAVAAAIFLGRKGKSKEDIKAYIETNFNYEIDGFYRDMPSADISTHNSVPQAFVAFLDSNDFEDAIRNAVYIGGDTDTLTCMTGAIAEAFYKGVPTTIETQLRDRLDESLLTVIDEFKRRYINS
jgi:ADP-ribosylglycohydrolase